MSRYRTFIHFAQNITFLFCSSFCFKYRSVFLFVYLFFVVFQLYEDELKRKKLCNYIEIFAKVLKNQPSYNKAC